MGEDDACSEGKTPGQLKRLFVLLLVLQALNSMVCTPWSRRGEEDSRVVEHDTSSQRRGKEGGKEEGGKREIPSSLTNPNAPMNFPTSPPNPNYQ